MDHTYLGRGIPRPDAAPKMTIVFLSALLLFLINPVVGQAEPIPRLVRQPTGFELEVNGSPFLLLGAQVHNSSGTKVMTETVWEQLRQLGANTLEVPVYWSELEPVEGELDFRQVNELLEGARANDVRLVLLWFATWKNGTMDYAPSWLKEAPERFPRMLDRAGTPTRVLSPHSEANLAADRRAFEGLMEHLREVDGVRHTVIMVQIQNEPGSLFVARDHSPGAQALFAADVPRELTRALGLPSGTWRDVFGTSADSAFSGYHVARYVNALARAGKSILPLPMSVNVWLKERKSWERPGEQYPSGGPTSDLLDLWKATAPDIDVLAPDIYVRDYLGFRRVCDAYSRDDNALLVPETFAGATGARYFFYALGEFDAIGYAPFGFNRRDGETELLESHEEMAKNYRLFGAAAPLLLKTRREQTAEVRRIQAAVEEDLLTNHLLRFDGWDVLVQFGDLRRSYGGEFAAGTPNRTGRALVVQTGADEFTVLGVDARVRFRPRDPEAGSQFLRVEEGTFVDGDWRARRALNGDQIFFGLRLPSEGNTLRVHLISGAGGGEHP